MVDVVAALPPPDRQSAAYVSNEDANQCVGGEVMRDAPMARVVSGEHDLVPEETQEARRNQIPAAAQKEGEEREECDIAHHLRAILREATGVESVVFDSLMKGLELDSDVPLGSGIERRVSGDIDINGTLDLARRVALWRQQGLRAGNCGGSILQACLHVLATSIILIVVARSEDATLYRWREVLPLSIDAPNAVSLHALQGLRGVRTVIGRFVSVCHPKQRL